MIVILHFTLKILPHTMHIQSLEVNRDTVTVILPHLILDNGRNLMFYLVKLKLTNS